MHHKASVLHSIYQIILHILHETTTQNFVFMRLFAACFPCNSRKWMWGTFLNLMHVFNNPFHGHDINGKWSHVKVEREREIIFLFLIYWGLHHNWDIINVFEYDSRHGVRAYWRKLKDILMWDLLLFTRASQKTFLVECLFFLKNYSSLVEIPHTWWKDQVENITMALAMMTYENHREG